jgi:hypothetical protein
LWIKSDLMIDEGRGQCPLVGDGFSRLCTLADAKSCCDDLLFWVDSDTLKSGTCLVLNFEKFN